MSQIAWNPYDRNCPTRQLLDRIGDRWTVLVIGSLRQGPTRFSQIARTVDGVSQKMLTQTLRALERDGLVTRTIYPEIPPRVEYELTELGRSLREPLEELEHWATAHMDAVLAARARATGVPGTNVTA
jgi:DNA-binding HxlR family transcriptional regulator